MGASTQTTVVEMSGEGDTPIDDDEEGKRAMEGLFSMIWWGDMEFKDILRITASTTALIPKGLEHAVAAWKSRVCEYIESARSGGSAQRETWGWKALLATDALLFANELVEE